SFSLWCRCRIRAQSSIEITHPIVVGWPGFHPSFLDWFSTAVDSRVAGRRIAQVAQVGEVGASALVHRWLPG
ncbi:hypothetical protein, partial [Rhodococcus zopfii]|uniref:hypothetical protein n=1 Tax=Rhodococcus zopfii TaxID=43772 RepID=UPI001EDDC3A0